MAESSLCGEHFFFSYVKTRKRGRERGRKRWGGGEAWCLAVSSSHVSLAAVSPPRARGIWWSISKCFMEGIACCPSCPGQLWLYVCLSLSRSFHPPASHVPSLPTAFLQPCEPSHRCVLAEALDGSLVLCRHHALLLHPGTIWGCFLKKAQSKNDPLLASLACVYYSSLCQNHAVS